MELRDRAGATLGVTGEVYDTLDATLPEMAQENYPLLSRVDRFGITVFQQTQLGTLGMELKMVLVDAPPKLAAVLRRVIDLCEEGSKVPGSCLLFLGD
jgi:hypothetical protein